MNETVNDPPNQNDAPHDLQPPVPRRGSRTAKWSRNLGVASWCLAGANLILFVFCTPPSDRGITTILLLVGFAYSAPSCALLAIILGHISNWRSRHPERSSRDDRAIWGLILGYMMLIVIVFVIVPAFARARQDSFHPRCQNNLKQMGLVFKMYANENRELLFPELSPDAGMLAVSNDSDTPVFPEYLTDTAVLFCVEKSAQKEYKKWRDDHDPQVLFNHSSYIYLGYAVKSDEEVEAFAEAYRQRIAQGLPFNEDLPVPAGKGNNGSDTIHRLREGVERYFITDVTNPAAVALAQSQIPVLIERPGNHEHDGGNVLYLDGHVEFIRYPGGWPMTKKTMAILQSIEAMRE